MRRPRVRGSGPPARPARPTSGDDARRRAARPAARLAARPAARPGLGPRRLDGRVPALDVPGGGALSTGSATGSAAGSDGLGDGLDVAFDGLLIDRRLGVPGDLVARRSVRRPGSSPRGRAGPAPRVRARRECGSARRLGRGDREGDGAGDGGRERHQGDLDLDLGLLLGRVDQSRLEPLQAAARVDRLRLLLGLRLLRLLADRAHDDGLPARRRLTVQLVDRSGGLRAVGRGAAGAERRGRCDPRTDQGVPLDRGRCDGGRRHPARGAGGGEESAVMSSVPAVSPCSVDCCSWCASHRPNRSFDVASWRWGSAAMSKRYGGARPRVTGLPKVVPTVAARATGIG